MSKEVMQQALEALERVNTVDDDCDILAPALADDVVDAITALEEALAQPEQDEFKPDWANFESGREVGKFEALEELKTQEPVAWMYDCGNGGRMYAEKLDGVRGWTPLYTSAPPRQPLTEEQITAILEGGRVAERNDCCGWHVLPYSLARAIEAAHGITGETE